MNQTSSKQVIVLAFSNDQDSYLQMIVRERRNIFSALQKRHDEGDIQVHKEENTSIKDVFELFILHFLEQQLHIVLDDHYLHIRDVVQRYAP